MSFFLYLAAAAWQDGREKQVSGWVFLFFSVHFLTTQICQSIVLADMGRFPANVWFYGIAKSPSPWELLWGCLIGAALLGISRITEGALGEGDGLFFMVSGLYLGFWRNLFFFVASLFLCSMAGLVFLARGKYKGEGCRKKTLPFLLFAFPVGMLLAGW